MPPDAEKEILRSELPKQSASEDPEKVAFKTVGSPTVALSVAVHPLASLKVTL